MLPASQGKHIKINLGNVATVGVLSILWVGAAGWVSNLLSRTDIPVIKELAVGCQYYLKAY